MERSRVGWGAPKQNRISGHSAIAKEYCPDSSTVARHDFNDLAGLAKQPLIAAEATRKHATEGNRTVCRTPVVNELVSDELRTGGRAALTGGQYDCAENTRRPAHAEIVTSA
jgi:hypothetical protein